MKTTQMSSSTATFRTSEIRLALKVGTDFNRVDFFTKHLGGDAQAKSMHRLLNTINRVPPLMPVVDKVFTAIELLSASRVIALPP